MRWKDFDRNRAIEACVRALDTLSHSAAPSGATISYLPRCETAARLIVRYRFCSAAAQLTTIAIGETSPSTTLTRNRCPSGVTAYPP